MLPLHYGKKLEKLEEIWICPSVYGVDCPVGHLECFHYLLLFGSRRTIK
ncbi:hypothetical protein ASZ78_007599, partial [Callipepla squamata]